MGKSRHGGRNSPEQFSDGFPFKLRFDGELAERGEIPAAELGAALQGWDRFLQLAVYSHEAQKLERPHRGTEFRAKFHVRGATRGSLTVVGTIYIGIGTSIVGGAALGGIKLLWPWFDRLIKAHIKAKREKKTLEGVVTELERLAKKEKLRISKNREDSEDFATALNSALDSATVPLDSSAARELLSLEGQTLQIVVNRRGRAAIRTPFDPPTLEEADDVIDASVKFIRINKKTGYGIFEFVQPRDESQWGQQRFHCDDKSIRRRANRYTGAFHDDAPLVVRMQRKAFESNRRGHFWLIIGTGRPVPADSGLFGPD